VIMNGSENTSNFNRDQPCPCPTTRPPQLRILQAFLRRQAHVPTSVDQFKHTHIKSVDCAPINHDMHKILVIHKRIKG
jgi:hypothetical protein